MQTEKQKEYAKKYKKSEKYKKWNREYQKQLRINNRQKIVDRENLYWQNNINRYVLKHARSSAKIKGLEFNLELHDIIIPTHCPVFGFELVSLKGKGKQKTNNSISIDRIDNTKGYVKGNIQIISWRANRIKADATIEELEKLLEYMKNGTRKNV